MVARASLMPSVKIGHDVGDDQNRGSVETRDIGAWAFAIMQNLLNQ